MKIFALIPARSGSKRVPGKNIRNFGGRPLISWTINAAIETDIFDEIVLSTDSEEIASIGRQAGLSVPELRPVELSTDSATSVDVALYELDRMERRSGRFDCLALLQPTSPFRTSVQIREAVSVFESLGGGRPVVSMSPVGPAANWLFTLTRADPEPLVGWDALKRGGSAERIQRLNGAIYLISPVQLREHRSFVIPGFVPFTMADARSSVDIDTEVDWRVAETFL